MEDYFLANYLDPIAKVWANAQPSYTAAYQEKKGVHKKRGYQKRKSITCNKKKQKMDFGTSQVH